MRFKILGVTAVVFTFGIGHIFEWLYGPAAFAAHDSSEIKVASTLSIICGLGLLGYSVVMNLLWLEKWLTALNKHRPDYRGNPPQPNRLDLVVQWGSIGLKVVERVIYGPWIFWPIAFNLSILGGGIIQHAASDVASAKMATFFAYYILGFHFFFSCSFFDMLLFHARGYGEEDDEVEGFSHFAISSKLASVIGGFLIIPVILATGALPFICSLLAPLLQGSEGTAARVVFFISDLPQNILNGYFALIVLGLGVIIVIGGWADNGPIIIISGIFVAATAYLVLFFHHVTWEKIPNQRPENLLKLLPALSVAYVSLQSLGRRVYLGDHVFRDFKDYFYSGLWLTIVSIYTIKLFW